MGLTAVSIATLRPLFRKILEKTTIISNKFGSSRGESRSRSQNQLTNRSSTGYIQAIEEEEIKLKRLQSKPGSEYSESSGIVYGGLPKDFVVTTTIQAMDGEQQQDKGTATKIQKRTFTQDDELPIMPIIYKRSEISTQRSFREDV